MIYRILSLTAFIFLFQSMYAQDTVYVCHQEAVDMEPLNSVNSKFLEFSPAYYSEGLVFVVARERNKLFDPKTGQAYFDLMYADLAPDGTTGRAMNFSPNIMTQYHEGPATFSADGREMFFTRSANIPQPGAKAKGADIKEVQLKIFHATRGDEDWENITELPFSSDFYSVAHPSLSPDGQYLAFSSNMPGGQGGMDLYVVKRNGDAWNEPVNLGLLVNSKGNEVFPFWHKDGYLFFSSDGWKGIGGLDIYVTKFIGEQRITGIQRLSFPLNSGRDDLGFIVAPDGMSGYFASDRKPTLGKDDLYRWSLPQSIFCHPPVPEMISHDLFVGNESGQPVSGAYVWLVPMSDDGPARFREHFETELIPDEGQQGSYYLRWGMMDTLSVATADGRTATSGSVTLTTNAHPTYALVVQHPDYMPYVTLFPAEALPSSVQLVSMPKEEVKCFNTNFIIFNADRSKRLEDAVITLTSKCAKEIQIRSDAEGNAQTCLPQHCQIRADISLNGYAPHSFAFTPEEEGEQWQVLLQSGEGLTSPPAPYTTGTVIVLDNIYYDFNKSAIRKSDAGELQALADILKKYPDLTIELTSHTDTRGTDEYNMELSQRRSDASKAYLVLLGVNASRIMTKAAGETMPRNRCVDGVECSEAEHQFNRRTEVRITNPARGMEVRYKGRL